MNRKTENRKREGERERAREKGSGARDTERKTVRQERGREKKE